MSHSLLFTYSLIVFGICFAALSFCTLYYFKPVNLTKIEKIPRNVILGSIFAIIDIAWCIPQATSIFSPGSITWIFPIAIIFLLIGCFFLDYLFARAIAGFLILLSHYFLLESFAANMDLVWIFSIACYVMGTFGIVIGGIPHILRDIFRKICSKDTARIYFTLIFAFYALVGIVYGVIQIIR